MIFGAALVVWTVMTAFTPLPVQAVKHSEFKSCTQSGFCRRNRALAATIIKNGASSAWKAGDLSASEDGQVSFTLERLSNRLKAQLTVLADDIIRFRLDPIEETEGRYRIPQGDVVVLSTSDPSGKLIKLEEDVYQIAGSQLKLKLSLNPFSLTLLSAADNDSELLVLNSANLLHFETGQPMTLSEIASDLPIGEDLWTEPHFRGRLDSRPKGPNSLALDIAFPESEVLYGIPEHASSLALKSTRTIHQSTGVLTRSDPYRLFNLDVFEYELDSSMALYGAIPIMLGHSTIAGKKHRSVGVFWNNPSETWVDIYDSSASSVGDNPSFKQLTHWMSESGSFEVFLMAGEDLKSLQERIKKLTGPPQLPPSFALGYHQCRWNYQNVADVLEVQEKFDEHELPVDVIWLDIEHTDGKKYMTWHPRDFADPLFMQEELARHGRKLVTIVDPHLKKDPTWPVYQELISGDLAVKAPDGKSTFEGKCWPGWSVWTDYSNPAARSWWSGLFSFEKYQNSTENLFIWNDMNEPSVFESPEITMPRDNVHFGGVEHRDLHNLYGRYQQESTFTGLIDRSGGKKRPFLLSRSFYAGSQRFGAIWTGDNAAKWDHLEAASPMLLSLGMVGYGFAGADVGGFFGNPSNDLLIRWYQAGSMQPFFRAHAHIEAKRREPYLFGEQVTESVKKALRLRYSLLPLWYTAFEESHRTGIPPMRAMITEFPEDSSMLTIDDQWMIASTLLFKPIAKSFASEASLKLPSTTSWYKYDTLELIKGKDSFTLSSPLIDDLLLFIRAGSILARKDIARRSSTAMRFDPYTLVVAVDPSSFKAQGSLYVDDEESFDYQEKANYLRVNFEATLSADEKTLSLILRVAGEYSRPGLRVAKVIVAHPQGRKEIKSEISLSSNNTYEIQL